MKKSRTLKQIVYFLLLSVIISSCGIFQPDPPVYKYSVGHFPATPVNLEAFNTEFDDYNSTLPYLGRTFPFCFSSNRNSQGANFDIVYKLMSVMFSMETGELTISEETHGNYDVYIENANILNALSKINTSFDEFGPCLISHGRIDGGTNWNGRYESYFFLYSNNSSGNQNIYFTQNLNSESYADPVPVTFLNSDFDDAYPTFNQDTSGIYFTSDRNGQFDIYNTATDKQKGILNILADEDHTATVEMDSILSSEFDDKCPSITNNLLVFTSDRAGGFGGFDLYYSYFENGKWSEPINFGSKINTAYDEYRPIVKYADPGNFDNDMMIFSSNRPGGKGGFDLYCVGIARKDGGRLALRILQQ